MMDRTYFGVDARGSSFTASDIHAARAGIASHGSSVPAALPKRADTTVHRDVQKLPGVKEGGALIDLSARAEDCAKRIIRDRDFSRLNVLQDAANRIVDAGKYDYIGGTRIPAQVCKVVLQAINANLRTTWDASQVAKALLGDNYAQAKAPTKFMGVTRQHPATPSTLGMITAALEDRYTHDMGLAEVIDQALMTVRTHLPLEDEEPFNNYVSKVIEHPPAAKFSKGTIESRIHRERDIDARMKQLQRPSEVESPPTVGESYAADIEGLGDLVDKVCWTVEIDYIPSQERLADHMNERARRASLEERRLRVDLLKRAKEQTFIDRCNANVSHAQSVHDVHRAKSKAVAKATRAGEGREAERRMQYKRTQRALSEGGTISFAAQLAAESLARKAGQGAASAARSGAAANAPSPSGSHAIDRMTSRLDPDNISLASYTSIGSNYSANSMFRQMDIDAVLNAPVAPTSSSDPIDSFRIPPLRVTERLNAIQSKVDSQLPNRVQLPDAPGHSIGKSSQAGAVAWRDRDPALK